MTRSILETMQDLYLRITEPSMDTVVLSPAVVPAVSGSYVLDNAVGRWGTHLYGNTWTIAHAALFCTPEVFVTLGLTILSQQLHNAETPVTLLLTHAASSIREIVVAGVNERRVGESSACVTLSSLRFVRRDLDRLPLSAGERVPSPPYIDRLPPNGVSPGPMDALGFRDGFLAVAELLLNAREVSTAREVVLECEAGHGGVAPGSAELTLWLPGNGLWEPF